jgi:hypothetical protein
VEFQREKRVPPAPSRNALGDVSAFFLKKPPIQTLIKFASKDERARFSQRIMQRIGIDPLKYSVLNLHKIGIDAPVIHVFEELLSWDGDSSCWPNNIARVERVDHRLEQIRIRPLGLSKVQITKEKSIEISPLFNLSALRIRVVPGLSDPDNARYMLYACSGGYPIGIFVLYVRSSIPSEGEVEQSQAFLGVGFDFYGKKKWSLFNPVNWLWEGIHNRVTANVLNRFKQLCEWRYERTQAGS